MIFTTTNGTRALSHARTAAEVLLAGFVNAGAVARRLADREHVHIICAGTDGKIGDDDVLLAGLLVERLQREGGMVYQQNGQAMTARETWLHAFALPQALGAEPLDPDRLAAELRKSLGGPKPDVAGPRRRHSRGVVDQPIRHRAAVGYEDVFRPDCASVTLASTDP